MRSTINRFEHGERIAVRHHSQQPHSVAAAARARKCFRAYSARGQMHALPP